MTPDEINQNYQEKKNIFYNYIDSIKKNAKWDIYSIINPTLVKNPYASTFPKNYFLNVLKTDNKTALFLKKVINFYFKNLYLLSNYILAYLLYKLYFKKKRKNNLEIIIDVFGLVDKTNQDNKFSENYLIGIYEVFEKFKINYAILVRPHSANKNSFKLKNFFKIISKDKRDFVFEYEFLRLFDFFRLLVLILKYPFQIFRVKQNDKSNIDKIFNNSLIEDLKHFSFNSLTRYILGEHLSKIDSIKKIYSWSEFQVIERSFNYAIRKNCSHIELIGLQFFINYETYFNSHSDDTDYIMLSSPHMMLVNGKFNLKKKNKDRYGLGISLRYKNTFNFKGIKKEKNILVLGSYIVSDSRYLLNSVKKFDNVIFKNHPAVDINQLGQLPNHIKLSNKSIYEIFKTTKIVVGTATGTILEAVGCGVSVIILASLNNLTANPLVKKGQGKIWEIASNENEIYDVYKKLIDYRKYNQAKIVKIANWYKNNFFVEPNEENIIKVFKLAKKNNSQS
jgi:hypothetical protein